LKKKEKETKQKRKEKGKRRKPPSLLIPEPAVQISDGFLRNPLMRTSLLLIQPLHLPQHILMHHHHYKDLSQELVHVYLIIRYFRF
jgi:hypothetical protein